jgi:hypothetical protein
MKKALLALGLSMASVSVPLTFAQKTPLPQAKKATMTKKTQHKAKKPGYAARHGTNSPAPNGARRSQGFEE